MMDEYNTENKRVSKKHSILLVIIYSCAFIGAVFSNVQMLTLIIISVCMVALSTKGKIDYIFPIAILWNDALGSIPGGFTVYYVFFFCVLIDLLGRFQSRRAEMKTTPGKLIYVLFSIFINFQMYASGATSVQRFLIGAFSMIWAYSTIERVIQKEEYNDFLFLSASAIALAIVASTISGYQGTYLGAFGTVISRAGLLGQGSAADPNMAALAIDTGFLLCMMSNMKKNYKIIFSCIFVFGLMRTVSLSGILFFGIAILLYLLFEAKYERGAWQLKVIGSLLAIIVLLFVFYYYADLTGNDTIISVRNRIAELFQQLSLGEFDDLSSGRFSVRQQGMSFFSQQGFIRQLFGGNSPYVVNNFATHNTYLEQLLRFGLLGFIVLSVAAIRKLVILTKLHYSGELGVPNNTVAGAIALKYMLFLFSYALSINGGCPLVIWAGVLYCI